MRLTAVLGILFVGAVAASPILSKNQVHNASESIETAEEDWHLVPDADGKLHLVDIRALDMEVEPRFVPFTDVIFRLFTTSNPTAPQVITIYNDAQLLASNFNPALQTRFTIHGWNGGGPLAGAFLRNAFLQHGSFNVFTVDWGLGSITPNYPLARGRVTAVGQLVAQFIDWINTHGASFASISVTGHSLGGHIAGIAGKFTTLGILASIVSLDPAGPLFSIDNPQDRVHHTDATYVEVIFTDMGQLAFEQPIGHANFYPNWGTAQPSCENNDAGGFCSHVLVNDFYIESINPVSTFFGATRCRDFNDIRIRDCVASGESRRLGGEPVFDGPSVPGSVFYLTTNAQRPFAQGPR